MGPDIWVPADCGQDFGLCSQSFHELQQGSVMVWLMFQERKTTFKMEEHTGGGREQGGVHCNHLGRGDSDVKVENNRVSLEKSKGRPIKA